MARKTNTQDKSFTRLYKTRDGRYGAIVGVHTRLRYIPDKDGHIYVEDTEDLQGFLVTNTWAIYQEEVLTIVSTEDGNGDSARD